MKLSKEVTNGFIIFVGISVYFCAMELLGLSDIHYLRFFNLLIVYMGVNRTLQSNFREKKVGHLENLMSAGITATVGVALSVIALVLYIYARGGEPFLDHLSDGILFAGDPTVTSYVFGLLFEGIVSGLVVCFVSMQFWQNKTKEMAD